MPTTTIFTKFAINHAAIMRHSFLFTSVSEESHHHAHGNYGKHCQHHQHDDIGRSEGKICGHKARYAFCPTLRPASRSACACFAF